MIPYGADALRFQSWFGTFGVFDRYVAHCGVCKGGCGEPIDCCNVRKGNVLRGSHGGSQMAPDLFFAGYGILLECGANVRYLRHVGGRFSARSIEEGGPLTCWFPLNTGNRE